jgi:hypothetical protein
MAVINQNVHFARAFRPLSFFYLLSTSLLALVYSDTYRSSVAAMMHDAREAQYSVVAQCFTGAVRRTVASCPDRHPIITKRRVPRVCRVSIQPICYFKERAKDQHLSFWLQLVKESDTILLYTPHAVMEL